MNRYPFIGVPPLLGRVGGYVPSGLVRSAVPRPSPLVIPQAPRPARLVEHSPRSIEDRVQLIRKMVYASIRDPEMSRGLALAVTHRCPWRDAMCELEAIHYFMCQNIRYAGDISGYDTYQSARQTFRYKGGDCDDGMTLIATLAMGNQFPVKGRITKNKAGGSWAHIYPLVGFPKMAPTTWIPLDWTLGHQRFGQHPPQAGHLEFDGHQICYGPKVITPAMYMGW